MASTGRSLFLPNDDSTGSEFRSLASFVQLEDPYMYKPEGEFSMQSDEQFDVLRRALLGLAGNLAFAAVLMPLRALAQASGGDKLRIGVIGSGYIGGTIGGLWVKAGHPVLFSSRHPEELKELVAGLGPLAQNGTVAQAISFGDVLFIAVPYGAFPQIGKDYGDAMRGKITLDACNAGGTALAEEVERDGIGVTSQKYLPGTRLVRAFKLSLMRFLRARRTVLNQGSPSRLRAMMPKRCRSRPPWCATPALSRCWSASLRMRGGFSTALLARRQRPGWMRMKQPPWRYTPWSAQTLSPKKDPKNLDYI